MKLSNIYAIDSLTESEFNYDFDDDDFDYDNLLDDKECIHEWRIDNVKNTKLCIKCGFTTDLKLFEEDTEYNESINIENNQISLKGVSRKLRQFNIWHESPSFAVKLFNEDLLRIKDICKKINILPMIGDDAQLIYKRFKNIIGFNKIIGKSSTKKKKISLIEEFKNNDDMIKEIIISDCKLRGDGRIGLLCGSIYYACLKNNICILPKVIIKGAGIKSKNMNDGCNALLQIRKLGDTELRHLMPVVCFPYPENYFKTVCDAFDNIFKCHFITRNDGNRLLELTDKMKSEFLDSLIKIRKFNLIFNHKTHSLAICMMLLYLTEKNYTSIKGLKKIICDEFDLSNPTINNTYQDLLVNKDFLLGFKNFDVIKPIIDVNKYLKFFENVNDNHNVIDVNVINSIDIYKKN